MDDWHCESVGRSAEVHVWIERAGVRSAKTVRLMGRRSARASILASGQVGIVQDWARAASWMLGCCADLDGLAEGVGKC